MSYRDRWILLSLVVLGTVLRLHGIGSLWLGFDENVTLNLGQAAWFTFYRVMQVREMNMVGYYALVRLWLKFDPDPSRNMVTFVRCLSVLFSVATIPTLCALGKKLFNENVGLLAAALLTINAFHIKHAQNARSYSLFVFLVTLATLLLVNNIENPNPKWGAYTCVWVLTAYIHVFAFLFLAAHLIAMIYIGVRPKITQLAWVFAGVAPMALWTATHRSVPTLNWVQPTTAASVADLFAIFVGNDGLFLLGMAVAAIIAAVITQPNKQSVRLLVIWALAPVALAIVGSLIQPCFVPRFLIPCLPATTVLVAAGIERLKPLHAAVLLAFIVFGMLMGTQPIGA